MAIEKDYEDPKEIIKVTEDEYPEFNKYKIKYQVLSKGKLGKIRKRAKSPKHINIGGGLVNLGKKMFGGIKYGAGMAAGAFKKGKSGLYKSIRVGKNKNKLLMKFIL